MSKNFPDQNYIKYGFRKILVRVGGYPAKEIYKYENDDFIISPLSDGSWIVYSKEYFNRVDRQINLNNLLTLYGKCGTIQDSDNYVAAQLSPMG